jgi:hypothetical protein
MVPYIINWRNAVEHGISELMNDSVNQEQSTLESLTLHIEHLKNAAFPSNCEPMLCS